MGRLQRGSSLRRQDLLLDRIHPEAQLFSRSMVIRQHLRRDSRPKLQLGNLDKRILSTTGLKPPRHVWGQLSFFVIVRRSHRAMLSYLVAVMIPAREGAPVHSPLDQDILL